MPFIVNWMPMQTRRNPMIRNKLLTLFTPRKRCKAPRSTGHELTAVMTIASTTPANEKTLSAHAFRQWMMIL